MDRPADVASALSRQPRAAGRLARLAANPPQSLILEGGSAAERLGLARAWAMHLNCQGQTPPCLGCTVCRQIEGDAFNDLHLFDGSAGVIKVEPVRGMRSTWGQPPAGDGRRVTIFAEAQRLMPEAANTLLKTLEEPRPGNHFVLTAPQRERLLETLVSRSFVLTLAWPEAGGAADDEADEWALALVRFIQTGREWFPRTSAKGAVDRDLALRVVLACQRELRRALVGDTGTETAHRLADLGPAGLRRFGLVLGRAQDALGTQTPVNPALVLDWAATRMR